MSLSPYEIALIGGGFTLLGTFLGAFITYRFALVLSKMEAKKNCGRRLVEAFSPELAAINPNLKIYPGQIKKILLDAYPKHRAAMIEYGFHLRENERAKYEQECNEYFKNVSSESLFHKYQTEKGAELFHNDIKLFLQTIET